MNTDVNQPISSAAEPTPVPTITIPANHPEPIDTGIRLEVQRVPISALDELCRCSAPQTAAVPPPFNPAALPIDPAVLQRMVAELIHALHTSRQETAELRQRFDELLRRLRGVRPDP